MAQFVPLTLSEQEEVIGLAGFDHIQFEAWLGADWVLGRMIPDDVDMPTFDPFRSGMEPTFANRRLVAHQWLGRRAEEQSASVSPP